MFAFLFLSAGLVHASFYRTTGTTGFYYGYGYGENGDSGYGYGYGYGYYQTQADYGFFGEDGKATDVSADATQTSFTVSFTSAYLAHYRIEYGLTDSFGSYTSTTGPQQGDLNIDVDDLTCGTEYYYRVETTDAGSNEWYSTDTSHTITTDACDAPATSSRSGHGGTTVACTPTRTTFCSRTAPAASPTGSSLSQAQIDSILGVLRSFGADQTTIDNVQKALLGQATAPAGVRDLELGMSGSDVTALQQLLIAQGYPIAAGATGFFGAQTKTALAAYQQAHSITPVTGYFGPVTRAQMKAAGLSGLWW